MMSMSVNPRILRDSYGRAIRDLRVSLTDRCNFRCFYCLPHGEPPIAPKEEMLSYEEIEYVCEIFVELGIEKIRLTGGEPMLRKDIETIVAKLAKLKISDKLTHVGCQISTAVLVKAKPLSPLLSQKRFRLCT